MWIYLIFGVFFLILELFYFRIARKYSILDIPNERSMHNRPIIRGGGVVFYIGMLSGLVYQWVQGEEPSYFLFLGLTQVFLISLLDDIRSLPNRVRIVNYGMALVFIMLSIPWNYPIYLLVIIFIIATGAINTYNFMDGINGITALYSLTFLLSIYYLHGRYAINSEELVLSTAMAVLIFSFFNVRKRALAFSGDVGSVTMGLLVVYLIMKLSVVSGTWIWVLFVAVYGVDSVLTIIHRIYLRENIFQAHRLHLFQVATKKFNIGHLVMSLIYAVLQLTINGIVMLYLANTEITIQLIASVAVLLILAVVYIVVKRTAMKIT